ncbi:MAG: phosphate acyltransferase PlsX [Elusimicrobia bacterium]|nr:phosphate acyltransferase PlsX [Elusimicrobiota bacterium]
MKIALDVMGGDHAPLVTIEGAINAAKEFQHEIILVGRENIILSELKKYKTKNLNIKIENASEVIDMDELPAQAVRQKKDSSLVVAAKLVADGKAEAFISAGNSGAAMASALLHMGRIPGVSRPAIATLFPTLEGLCILLDVGANVDCKPKHLQQFAIMGSLFMKEVKGIDNPKVGLASIGEEDTKGNELTLAAFELIKKSNVNFIGNIEGRDISRGKAEVVVCDGFVGNIILKYAEGAVEMLLKLIKSELKSYPITWVSLPFLWAALKDLRKKLDYTEYGGAPLLGVNGACLICHGRSNAKAIKNAFFSAAKYVEKGVTKAIADEMSKIENNETE